MCNVVLCRSGVQLYSGVQYSWWRCSRPQLGRATSWEETLTTHHRCDAGFLHENLIFNIDNNTNNNNNNNSSWRRTSRKKSTTQNTNVSSDISEKFLLWYRVLRSVRWQKYRCGALLRWLGSNLLLTTCHHSVCTIPPSFSWPPRHSQFYYSEKTESAQHPAKTTRNLNNCSRFYQHVRVCLVNISASGYKFPSTSSFVDYCEGFGFCSIDLTLAARKKAQNQG